MVLIQMPMCNEKEVINYIDNVLNSELRHLAVSFSNSYSDSYSGLNGAITAKLYMRANS
jgi:hypothetical protein